MAKKPRKPKQERKPGKKVPAARKAAYPLWAKVIMSVVLFGWLACVYFFIVSAHTCVAVVRHAPDPAYIEAITRKIARIDKLPAGFKPIFAVSLFNSSLLTLNYEPDHTGFMVWSVPPEQRRWTARQLVDSMAEKGIPTISDDFKVEKKGAIPVSGETMEYVSGEASSKQGNYGGFVGCAVLKDKRAIFIYGWTPPKLAKQKAGIAPQTGQVSFDMDAVNSLLSSVKGF